MPVAPYSQYRNYQFGGPLNSDDYNEQVEEKYKDLVVLYNWLNQLDEVTAAGFKMAVKDLLGLAQKMAMLEVRVRQLEADAVSGYVSFQGQGYTTDADRFDGTGFEIAEVDRLSTDSLYPGIFLPPSGTSSAFQSAIVLGGDSRFVPDSVETLVTGVTGSADTVGSVIDTTQPELSFGRVNGPNWERNVVCNTVDVDGAELTLYVKVPPDVSPNAKCSYVVLHPYPVYTVDILDVAVSTKASVILDESDNYLPLNKDELYSGEDAAVGIAPPGGWDGDEDLLAGNRLWIFDPREVTALRIKLRQRNYYSELDNYVYTYGANKLDIGYLKTLDTGKTIIKYEAPAGHTISDVVTVVPEIFNVPQAYLPDVFSYRVIWETAPGSNVYTTDPVALSEQVWIEVTLSRAPDGTVPMLSGISIEAS